MKGTKGEILENILWGAGVFLAVVLSTAATLLCRSVLWMFDTWNNLTMDELVFHLKAPLEGTNKSMIQEYAASCISVAILVMILLIVLFIGFRKYRIQCGIIMVVSIVLSCVCAGYFLKMTWTKLDIGNYARNQGSYSSFFDANYVNPKDVEITFPEQKRNLIYIFLESMETTYTDTESGGAFEESCIPELTKLAEENESFAGGKDKINGAYTMPGSTWTIAAMLSQTSGIPLNISIEGNAMDTQEAFFPSIMNIGDILEQAGYSQTLMIGSEAAFGGRELLFTEHGNYDIWDYNYAHDTGAIPKDYRVFWGYEDKRLFGFAKNKLEELSQEGGPFHLSMLTVDTHFEDGYVCESCDDEFGENQYANVMRCSSKQVAEFVSWIQEQDFYENTTIVISGDHLTMDSDFCEEIGADYDRKTYTAYINSAVENENDTPRKYTTFDHFPTTLASLGVSIEGNRLGLGTNLFSHEPTLIEHFGLEMEAQELSKKSKLLEKLADVDGSSGKQLLREGNITVPSASVIPGTYDFETGILPVHVSSIENARESIALVRAAVWNAPDQSDLQWIEAVQQEDGSYVASIDVPGFSYKTGEYKIDIYMVDSQGNQSLLGSTAGIVE